MKDIECIIRKTYQKEISGFVSVLLRRDVNKLLHKPFVITQLQLRAVGFVCRFVAYSYVFYVNNLRPPECTFYDLRNMYYYGISKFHKKWVNIVRKIDTKVNYYLSRYVKDIIEELKNRIELTYKGLHVKSVGNGFVITEAKVEHCLIF
ncbi:MAG: hypothetical protein QXF12_01820 [Candidatus Aenigmatarchaeota archaeon]